MQTVNIFWFRRDLRLTDNVGLYHALKTNLPVLPIFIFDKNILEILPDKLDRRVEYIHAALHDMQVGLQKMGSSLQVFYGKPEDAFITLLETYKIEKVFTNHDYESYAKKRDHSIADLLMKNGILFHSFKDQAIFEKDEVIKDDGKPYTVFTPYSRKWKTTLEDYHLKAYPTEKYFNHFYKQAAQPIPSLQFMGFESTHQSFPKKDLQDELIKKYGEQRN